jgi:phosphopantetheinyl transferase (holo-ACP synthase)
MTGDPKLKYIEDLQTFVTNQAKDKEFPLTNEMLLIKIATLKNLIKIEKDKGDTDPALNIQKNLLSTIDQQYRSAMNGAKGTDLADVNAFNNIMQQPDIKKIITDAEHTKQQAPKNEPQHNVDTGPAAKEGFLKATYEGKEGIFVIDNRKQVDGHNNDDYQKLFKVEKDANTGKENYSPVEDADFSKVGVSAPGRYDKSKIRAVTFNEYKEREARTYSNPVAKEIEADAEKSLRPKANELEKNVHDQLPENIKKYGADEAAKKAVKNTQHGIDFILRGGKDATDHTKYPEVMQAAGAIIDEKDPQVSSKEWELYAGVITKYAKSNGGIDNKEQATAIALAKALVNNKVTKGLGDNQELSIDELGRISTQTKIPLADLQQAVKDGANIVKKPTIERH